LTARPGRHLHNPAGAPYPSIMDYVPYNPHALGVVELFPDRVRLPLSFNPEPLVEAVRAVDEEAWYRHFLRQNYEGEWSIVPLRCAAGETHPIRMIAADPSASEFVDTPLLEAMPAFRAPLALLPCELQSVRLMRLAPGSIIKEHFDPGMSAEEGLVRLHMPITSNPDVEFCLNDKAVTMEPGSVWYLRFADPHRIANRGSSGRVHLVIDAVVNDWLREMLRNGASD
jgi:hypothetical protein